MKLAKKPLRPTSSMNRFTPPPENRSSVRAPARRPKKKPTKAETMVPIQL